MQLPIKMSKHDMKSNSAQPQYLESVKKNFCCLPKLCRFKFFQTPQFIQVFGNVGKTCLSHQAARIPTKTKVNQSDARRFMQKLSDSSEVVSHL